MNLLGKQAGYGRAGNQGR